MALNILDFATIVRNQVTAIQGRAAGLVDLSVGSILRAVVESTSAVAQWQQSLIISLLQTTRAATCSGSDLDTWMADYNFYRLSASQSTGIVTFSRFTASNQAIIPVGTVVTTTDGTQQYVVVADLTKSAYNASLAGYIVAAGVVGLDVPVQAITAGSAGNAMTGTVTVITGGIQYIDTVTNNADFAGGLDAESDNDFRTRFITYINSLEKATPVAVKTAINSVRQGLLYSLVENENYARQPQNGYFYVVIDDGSGSPTEVLREAVYAAIDKIRPITSTFAVFVPKIQSVTVQLYITTDPSVDHLATCLMVSDAISIFISGLGLGVGLPLTRLAQVAYDANPAVVNVTQILINGISQDLAGDNQTVIKPNNIQVL